MDKIEYLTAESESGRLGINEVMAQSYQADLETVPPEWAITRVVNGIPVAFILIDPSRIMHFPGCGITYGFILDVATRKDRRWEGHFRGIMEEGFQRLQNAGIPLVGCHGRYQLYRRYGFEVFTYNCGIFIRPESIEEKLGAQTLANPSDWIKVSDVQFVLEDLLLVFRVRGRNYEEARQSLLAAASLARQKGKARILFEHPEAPSYGSTYPMYTSPETPLANLARACGGRLVVQGANPEEGTVPDADWLKVLDVPLLVEQALNCLNASHMEAPTGVVQIDTDAGSCSIESNGQAIWMDRVKKTSTREITLPATAFCQLVTGYQSIAVLDSIYQLGLPGDTIEIINILFPPTWRFSRNESWTYHR